MQEGLAIYSEPPFKKRYYYQQLSLAARQKRLFSVEELLSATAYPEAESVDVFYAQSLSLATYLIEKKSYKRVLSFLGDLRAHDDWSTWRRFYDIRSASHLENVWKQAVFRR